MKYVVIIGAVLFTLGGTFGNVSHAAVCATNDVGVSESPSAASNYDTNTYGIAFTVASDCDVSSIKLTTKYNGSSDNEPFVIYNTAGTVLVTGGAAASTATCALNSSAVTPGTYTLVPATTYYVGMEYDASGKTKICNYTTGDDFLSYYASGWSEWIYYSEFEIEGAEPAGGGGDPVATTTYATSTTILYYDWLFMSSLQLFFLALIGMGIIFAIFKQQGPVTGSRM